MIFYTKPDRFFNCTAIVKMKAIPFYETCQVLNKKEA